MDPNKINIKQVLSRKNNIDQLYEIKSASVQSQRESHILTIQPMQNIFLQSTWIIILKPTRPLWFLSTCAFAQKRFVMSALWLKATLK